MRARARTSCGVSRGGKRLVDIGGDRAGLIDREIAVLEDRNAIERMQRKVLRLAHHGFKIVEAIGDVLVSQDQSHNVDIGASREAVDDRIGHLVSLSLSLSL